MTKKTGVFGVLVGIWLVSSAFANEWHAEFRRAVIVSKSGQPQVQAALQKHDFDILSLAPDTPGGGEKFQAFLDAIPTNGVAFIYIEAIEQDAQQSPLVVFEDASVDLMDLARQLCSVGQKFENVNRHTASRQNVVLIQQPLEAKTLKGFHRTVTGRGANHTLAAVRKPDAEVDLADIAADWLKHEETKVLRDLLAPHAALNSETSEPIQLGRSAATAISPPERLIRGRKAGDHWISPGGHVLVWCPPGKFVMGDEQFEDAPPTEVMIERGFWISKYEFARGGMFSTPHGFPPNRPKTSTRLTMPRNVNLTLLGGVDGVITEFLEPIPAHEGWSWDLPTEAEWEYACRAGSTKAFPCKLEDLGQHGNFADKSLYDDRVGVGWFRQVPASGPIHFTFAYQGSDDGKAHEFADIGSYKPNAWGIHDMLGNLAEICVGYYHPKRMATVNYESSILSSNRRFDENLVLRGGAWCHPPSYLHASFRSMSGAAHSSSRYVGFRPVLREGPRLALKRDERLELIQKQEAQR